MFPPGAPTAPHLPHLPTIVRGCLGGLSEVLVCVATVLQGLKPESWGAHLPAQLADPVRCQVLWTPASRLLSLQPPPPQSGTASFPPPQHRAGPQLQSRPRGTARKFSLHRSDRVPLLQKLDCVPYLWGLSAGQDVPDRRA